MDSEWIYCKDRLPEVGGLYLISFDYGLHQEVCIARFSNSGNIYPWNDIHGRIFPYAWMPIPEPARM